MYFKSLIIFLAFSITLAFAGWKQVAPRICVGARNNNFRAIAIRGHSFIIAMKLTHLGGKIGCRSGSRTNWGCRYGDNRRTLNMIVTDNRNKRIFPSPLLVKPVRGNWYEMPGYNENSGLLVFALPGYQYMYHGQVFRFWYGEDLSGHTEGDNHGHTCMKVEVFTK
ncbi:uncharacterized protein LOC124449519 [Xenia sp. Carnegie-2017]|uniref:uncharacterized protein LOC124449519 n=1 Tax=Xenia sp. Carnegie-2017 TaxID=2897299 RepID=UPI001F0450F0|nr:uncharacterized protein LOC124449519 [Xenia sp. Carnegie-2017]